MLECAPRDRHLRNDGNHHTTSRGRGPPPCIPLTTTKFKTTLFNKTTTQTTSTFQVSITVEAVHNATATSPLPPAVTFTSAPNPSSTSSRSTSLQSPSSQSGSSSQLDTGNITSISSYDTNTSLATTGSSDSQISVFHASPTVIEGIVGGSLAFATIVLFIFVLVVRRRRRDDATRPTPYRYGHCRLQLPLINGSTSTVGRTSSLPASETLRPTGIMILMQGSVNMPGDSLIRGTRTLEIPPLQSQFWLVHLDVSPISDLEPPAYVA